MGRRSGHLSLALLFLLAVDWVHGLGRSPSLASIDREERHLRSQLVRQERNVAKEQGFDDAAHRDFVDGAAGGWRDSRFSSSRSSLDPSDPVLRIALDHEGVSRAGRIATGTHAAGAMDPAEQRLLNRGRSLSPRRLDRREAQLNLDLAKDAEVIRRGLGDSFRRATAEAAELTARADANMMKSAMAAGARGRAGRAGLSGVLGAATDARDASLRCAVGKAELARKKRLEATELETRADRLSTQMDHADERIQRLRKALFKAVKAARASLPGGEIGEDDPNLLKAEARADEHEARLERMQAKASLEQAKLDRDAAGLSDREYRDSTAAAALRRQEADSIAGKEVTARAKADADRRAEENLSAVEPAEKETLLDDEKALTSDRAHLRAEQTIAGDLRQREGSLEVRAARAAVRAMRSFMLARTAEKTMSETAKVEREASAKAEADKAKALMDQLEAERNKREEEEASEAERVAKMAETRDETEAHIAKAKARDSMEAMREAATLALNALRLATTSRAGEAAAAAAAALQRSRTKSSLSQEKGGHTSSKNDLSTVSKDYVEEKEYKLRMDNLQEAPGHQSMYPPLMAAAIAAAAMALGKAKGQQARERAGSEQKDAGMVQAADDMQAAEGKRAAAVGDEITGAQAEAAAKVAKAAAAARLADACADKLKAMALGKIEKKSDFLKAIKGLMAGKASLAAAKNLAIARATGSLRDELAGKVKDLGEHRLRLEERAKADKDDEKDYLRRKIRVEEQRLLHEKAIQEASADEAKDIARVHDDRVRLLQTRRRRHADRLAVDRLTEYLLKAHRYLAHARHSAALEDYAARLAAEEKDKLEQSASIAESHAAAESRLAREAEAEAKRLWEKEKIAERKERESMTAGQRAALAKRDARELALGKRKELMEATAARQALRNAIRGNRARAERLREEAAKLEDQASICRKRAERQSAEVDKLEAEADKELGDRRHAGGKDGERKNGEKGKGEEEESAELTLDDLALDPSEDTDCDKEKRKSAARVGKVRRQLDRDSIEEVRTIKDT